MGRDLVSGAGIGPGWNPDRQWTLPEGVLAGPSPPQAVSVARLGGLRWAELAIFAVAGDWVRSTPEPAARVALAGVSRHAARRAAVIADRLPSVGALAAPVVTVPRSAALADAVTDMAEITGTGDRLALLGEFVLPGVAEDLAALLASLSPVADATCLRTLPPLVTGLRSDGSSLVACVRAGDLQVSGGTLERLGERFALTGGW